MSDRPAPFNKVFPYLVAASIVLTFGKWVTKHSTADTPFPGATSSVEAAATPTVLPATTNAERLFLADLVPAPAGSIPWNAHGPVGLLDLNAFIGYYFTEAAQAASSATEQKWGFQYAARRTWHASDGAFYDVAITRFSTVNGAEHAYLSGIAGIKKSYNITGSVAVPQLPHSQILVTTGPDAHGNAKLDLFAQAGNTLIDVYSSNRATPKTATASAVALQQYRTLCVHTPCDG